MKRSCVAAIGFTLFVLTGCVYEPQYEVSCVVDRDCPEDAVCRGAVCVVDESTNNPTNNATEGEVATLEVAPATVELLIGDTQQFEATALDAGGTPVDAEFTWSAEDTSVAEIDESGLLTAIAAGSTAITVQADGVETTANVTVFDPVASIEVMPDQVSLPHGHTDQITATPLDGNGEEVAGRTIVWESDDDTVVDVLDDGTIIGIGVGTATITASVDEAMGQASVEVTTNPVDSVTITPMDPMLVIGTDTVFEAVIVDGGGVELERRGRIFDWDSDNFTSAVRNPGDFDYQAELDAKSVGEGYLSVDVDEGDATATINWTVIEPPVTAVDIIGLDPIVPVGSVRQLVAEVTAGGEVVTDRTVTWESSDEAVATVDADGQFVALAPGTAMISAEADGFRTTVNIEVLFLLDQLSAGNDHSCGVSPEGLGFCWGDNSAGELGVGDDMLTNSRTPLVIPGLAFTGIWAGTDFACGLDVNGDAYCWGRSDRVGTADGMASNVPRLVDGSHDFVSLAAGFDHACGIDAAGLMWCWGEGGKGRLGNGGTMKEPAPVEVAFTGPGTPVGLAIGAEHTCAVTDTPSIWCWGDGASGRLGNGDNDMDQHEPVEVMADLDFASVTAGSATACSRLADNSVYCWGDNANGALGIDDMDLSDADVPAELVGVKMAQIDFGETHACGVLDNAGAAAGPVHCWGSASNYQLGNMDNSTDLFSPAPVSGGLVGTAVAAGNDHVCAIADDQRVYCWGDNTEGRGGTDAATELQAPTLVWP